MPRGVLALTIDGRLTYCTCPPDQRGRGRCNHVHHQETGESVDQFIERVNQSIAVEDGTGDQSPSMGSVADVLGADAPYYPSEYVYDMAAHQDAVEAMPDNIPKTRQLVGQYGIVKDPDWETVIRSIPNPFHVGKEEDGSYEEAEMVDFKSIPSNDGTNVNLVATYEFRGKQYDLSWGRMPVVQEDGTIVINGGHWRPLPVLAQRKSGVVSYATSVVLMQDNGHFGLSMPKSADLDTAKILGVDVPLDDVNAYWQRGEPGCLTEKQCYILDHIDPIAYERFPTLKQDGLQSLKNLPEDDVNDLSYRKCIQYQDMVKIEMEKQARRMGVTFRNNLAKRRDLMEAGMVVEDPQSRGQMTEDELEVKYPLFYQVNLTDNVAKMLTKRSNVQNAESLNPISALTQAQKISLTGPGGFNKDSAPSELRMPHPSHRGIVDALVASSGKNVGLTSCISGGYIDERGFIQPKGRSECLSPSDFIPFKLHDDPSRANMACAHLTQACPITGGEDPLVSTPAWDSIRGAKLGLNLKVAYVEDKDCFEDGVKISQSAAARMTTVQRQPYVCHDKRALAQLREGQYVERKDMVGGVEVKYGGVVKSIREDGFDVETVYAMGVGDKISNRHGGKSVVAKIVPDDQMPHILDESTGRLVASDIVMTPNGVVGRKNLGQVMECNQAAKMTGLQMSGDGSDADLLNHTSTVVVGGRRVEATAGVEYVLRLNHLSEKKLSSHADEFGPNHQSDGIRLGEMESILLSTDEDRLKILNYLRHQEAYSSHQQLNHLLKAVGVDMQGVNWDGV